MSLTRREFLKFFASNLAAFTLLTQTHYRGRAEESLDAWPWLKLDGLPARITDILAKVPPTAIDRNGFLVLLGPDGQAIGPVSQAQTLWNQENSRPAHRLNQNYPWGIVLHWYGDQENFEKTVKGYLRGFDSLRKVDNYTTRTSAHFLVGDELPSVKVAQPEHKIGILQTQAPAKDGVPFVASHLMPLDLLAYQERRNYFVRALYQLGYTFPTVNSLLVHLFEGQVLDPNTRTIAIETTGYAFESPGHYPGDQKIANVVSVAWALMKRYRIRASNILGHQEIQSGKPDPGKKFTTLVRYLLGVKALIEKDLQMCELIFGQFLIKNPEPRLAVSDYFQYVRGYLVLTSTQRRVYEWEAESNYWLIYDLVSPGSASMPLARQFCPPMPMDRSTYGFSYLQPPDHEGIDFYNQKIRSTSASSLISPVQLITSGKCIYTGQGSGHSDGQIAIFKHRQPDGAESISIYSHLSELGSIQVESLYPTGYPVGALARQKSYTDPFLHFAVGYGATWETDLIAKPHLPLNADVSWIRRRFMNPFVYLDQSFNRDKPPVYYENS